MYAYRYPRPVVAVDAVIFGLRHSSLSLLVVRRGIEPFSGDWCLPGGHVEPDEPLNIAARRELREDRP